MNQPENYDRGVAVLTRAQLSGRAPEKLAQVAGVSVRTVREALAGDCRRPRAVDLFFQKLLCIPEERATLTINSYLRVDFLEQQLEQEQG